MKERPMPFIAPMVRALLEGSKTQTRRVVKPKAAEVIEYCGGCEEERATTETVGQGWHENQYRIWSADYPEEGSLPIGNLCGQPGDRLWVREAWRVVDVADCFAPREITAASRIWYEADAPHQPGFGRYRPGMFMPRWASRITLEITGLRIERLQDISGSDALAEGVGQAVGTPLAHGSATDAWNQRAYSALWEQINGPGSWAANPWVWVIEFQRVTP